MQKYSKLWASLIAIAIGITLGIIVILISNPQYALEGIATIIEGGFVEGTRSFGNTLFEATPIILTGLSIGFAYKTGLFNIGAPGQFTVGGLCAILVGTHLPEGIFTWFLAVLAAIIGGMFWGMLVGILKACFNINEVISSIMLNYTAMFGVNYLIMQFAYDSVRNQSLPIPVGSRTPIWGLDHIFVDSKIDISFIIAIVTAILIYILLNKSVFGYELKAVGFNKDAAKYAGINERRSIVYSMMVAGALSGLAGAMVFLASNPKFIEVIIHIQPEGFDGISVALLGQLSPIGIIFAGIFVAYLNVAGFYMQSFHFVPEIANIIVATIIYCASFTVMIQLFLKKIHLRKGGKHK